MKKILLTLLLAFLLAGCMPKTNEVNESLDYLDIYYVNDLHGAIEKEGNNLGLSYIANYIEHKREENPRGTILLAGGDMLQGSALSNYYQGESTLTIMEMMGFDAMVVGNHEFDWGIDVVTNFFQRDNFLSFPLLGANIYYKGTNNLHEFIQPYSIIAREEIKIGIIGIMGYGLESSIATSKVKDFEFARSLTIVKKYASYLRIEEGCDFVFVLSHDAGAINSDIDKLTGDEHIDVIFNAHDHKKDVTRLSNGTLAIKSGSSGQAIGHVKIDLKSKALTAINVTADPLLNQENRDVAMLIDQYQLETDDLFKTPIIKAGEFMSQEDLTVWIAKLIRDRTQADIAFHNTGGTRTSISNGELINYAKIYQILPFDNVVKSAYLKGVDIKRMISDQSLRYDSGLTTFNDQQYYLVSTNDYVYDQTGRPFNRASEQRFDGYILRDLMRDELILQAELYHVFLFSNELLIYTHETDQPRP